MWWPTRRAAPSWTGTRATWRASSTGAAGRSTRARWSSCSGPRPGSAEPLYGPGVTVRVEGSGPVRTVVLDRPEVRNAVDRATADALAAAFRAVEAGAGRAGRGALGRRRHLLRRGPPRRGRRRPGRPGRAGPGRAH